jgi:glycosyltransferase involved in cell wall biosynthesis
MKISLCLMVWNELEGCRIDIPLLPRDAFQEIYAVDGGSTDGTVEYLESQGIPVHRQPKRGLNAAYIHAAEMSRCDAVAVFFPKATVDPETLRQFRPLLEAGNELVVASRNCPGGRNEEDENFWRPRKLGVQALSMGAALLWRREGPRVRDVLHGYKAFTVAAFRRMDPLDHGLSIDIEMVIRSYRMKIKRVEFPVREVARSYGDTRFKIWPTAKLLLRYLWSEVKRRDCVAIVASRSTSPSRQG